MKKVIKYTLAVAAVLVLAACSKDGITPGQDVIVMNGTSVNTLVSFGIEDTVPVTYPVSVLSTGKVSEDVKVEIAIDNSLVESYNKANRTALYALPETDIELDSSYVTIPKGKASSAVNHLTLKSLANFEAGKTYMVPVTIKSTSSGTVLEAERTIYIRIAQTVIHSSIDINNANFSSNYIFPDDLAVNLSNYTFEIKIYPYSWNGMTPNLSRLCAFEDKNEKNALLYRFGEKEGEDRLQVMTPGGNVVSNTKYQLNRWTMISVVYDGSAVALYNDGVFDVSTASTSGATTFQRVELGMSWTSYCSSQLYHGRVAEIRVWDKALSASEIKGGLCGVASDSEGLVAYYRFDESGGSIFKDATGHGYDMDWSKSVREVTEGAGLVTQDKSAYIVRVKDDNNKCVN